VLGKYGKWLFWGGILGTAASVTWSMMEKRKKAQSPQKYRLIRSMASKTMGGLSERKRWE